MRSSHLDYEEKCEICFVEYEENIVIPKILPCCKKIYCFDCITNSFNKWGNCPNCKEKKSDWNMNSLQTKSLFAICPNCKNSTYKTSLKFLSSGDKMEILCRNCNKYDNNSQEINFNDYLKDIKNKFKNIGFTESNVLSYRTKKVYLRKINNILKNLFSRISTKVFEFFETEKKKKLDLYEKSYNSFNFYWNLLEQVEKNENDLSNKDYGHHQEFLKHNSKLQNLSESFEILNNLQNIQDEFEINVENIDDLPNKILREIKFKFSKKDEFTNYEEQEKIINKIFKKKESLPNKISSFSLLNDIDEEPFFQVRPSKTIQNRLDHDNIINKKNFQFYDYQMIEEKKIDIDYIPNDYFSFEKNFKLIEDIKSENKEFCGNHIKKEKDIHNKEISSKKNLKEENIIKEIIRKNEKK